MQHTDRTYRQINPDAHLDDGIRRARRRNYYRPHAPCREWPRALAIIAVCIAWSLVVGWLVNR